MSGRLILDNDILTNFLFHGNFIEKFSSDFPAELLTTPMEWGDLVLNAATLRQIKELETWISYNDILKNDWEMSKKLKPGYKTLFYGPPGTGKTLTATLLGKYTKRHVYRIDLSAIVSKYIGETEKNLSKLFDKAQNKNWILFFDEADAVFSKRTNVRDAHDKYANQEASYLLQRIETYPGVVILASNFKSNLDEAFIRRFQSIIYFSMPSFAERQRLWENAFPKQVSLADTIYFHEISQKYELSGSNIMNIVQFCCLQALS